MVAFGQRPRQCAFFGTPHGLGLGYDRFAFHVDLSKAGFTGGLSLGYQGLLLFVKGGF